MRRALGDAHGHVDGERGLGLQPAGGRAARGADGRVVVEDLQGDRIFAGDDLIKHLTRGGLEAMYVLLAEFFEIGAALFLAHFGQHEADEPLRGRRDGNRVPRHLALPFGVEQVVPVFRLGSLGDEVGVVAGRQDIFVAGGPVAFGIDVTIRELDGGNPFFHQVELA